MDRPRALLQRFSHYLSVLLIGPVLFFAAVGATASLRSSLLFQRVIAFEPLGFLLESAGRIVPFVLITLAFTFVYAFVPNTRVKLRSALVGALIAGLLWQAIGQLFATFMSGSTKYAAIYAGLAILILFMIWLYTAWLILLIGANIAFYHQYPEYLGSRARDLRLSNRLRERLGLVIAARVVTAHFSKDPPWTADGLAHAVGMPFTNVRNLLRILEGAGVLVRTASWTGPSVKCVGEPNRLTDRALSPMARSPMRTTISPRLSARNRSSICPSEGISLNPWLSR